MLAWHDRQIEREIFCPFCQNGLPDYVTRISPERMMVSDRVVRRMDIEPDAEESGDRSPFTIEFFMVQGSGYRCMAYRHRDGKWRGAFDNEELPGVVRVLE
jgi:hypothetical protein